MVLAGLLYLMVIMYTLVLSLAMMVKLHVEVSHWLYLEKLCKYFQWFCRSDHMVKLYDFYPYVACSTLLKHLWVPSLAVADPGGDIPPGFASLVPM